MAYPTVEEMFHSAVLHQRGGRIQQAEQILLRILAIDPGNADAHFSLGLIAGQGGKFEIAIRHIAKAIEKKPHNALLHYHLGFAYLMRERHDEAIRSFRHAVRIRPGFVEAYNILGIALRGQGRNDEAISSFQHALNIKPDYADALNNLGLIFKEQGKLAEAVSSFAKALEINPDFAEANNNLGNMFHEQGRQGEALRLLQRAVHVKPDYTEAFCNLGNVLKDMGRLDEAVDILRKALSINPDYSVAYTNLGNVYVKQASLDKAVSCFNKALALNPGSAETYYNLGNAYLDLGHPSEALDKAVAFFRKALSLNSEFAEAYYNLGNTLARLGRPEEAIAHYRMALARKHDFAAAHSNLLCAMHYLPEVSQEEIFQESTAWDRQHAQPLQTRQHPHANSKDKDRRLKIGYVSPDFKAHAVNFFFEPLLKTHDRDRFDIHLYANVSRPDEVTMRLQAEADHWVSIASMSDGEAAAKIRADEIDILVDLTKHTGYNRLLIFAYKPAPIQVTWLGYPSTSGMAAIDYRIADELTNPTGVAEAFNTETLIRLPDGFFCLQPIPKAPEVGPCPAKKTGRVTFGSFNNLQKLNGATIGTWAQILHKVPDSRLVMIGKDLNASPVIQKFRNLFGDHGIGADRVEMVPSLPYFEFLAYLANIDIALDSFPYNGHTTTCICLWMGVPVITLRGQANCSRVGASILTRIGLTELISDNVVEYVTVAQQMAEDPDRLAALRTGMRERILTSPLADVKGFAESLEKAYSVMWERYASS